MSGKRRSIRYKGYDYRWPRFYFVTICVEQMECLLGTVQDKKFVPSSPGKIVRKLWNLIPAHFPTAALDAFQVMPNHIHGIIRITENEDNIRKDGLISIAEPIGTKPDSLGAIPQNFKSVSTREINRMRKTKGKRLWQRGFHDRVIRNQRELNLVRLYFEVNPEMWETGLELKQSLTPKQIEDILDKYNRTNS